MDINLKLLSKISILDKKLKDLDQVIIETRVELHNIFWSLIENKNQKTKKNDKQL